MAKVWRDRGKERFWRQHLAAWRRSGRGVRDYCRSAGVSEPSFYAWRRVLAERQAARRTVAATRKQAERQEQSTTAAAFVPVRLIAESVESAVAGSVEVVVRGGRVVRVAAGFAAATLREVVAVLEGLPC
jgi:hypothetical protein